jgi:hypothetical protein
MMASEFAKRRRGVQRIWSRDGSEERRGTESTFRGGLVDVDDVDSKELACADVGKPQIGLHVLLIKELGRKAPRKQKTPAKGWRKGKNT